MPPHSPTLPRSRSATPLFAGLPRPHAPTPPRCHGLRLIYFNFKQDVSRSPEMILKEITDNLAKDFPSNFLTVAKHTYLSSLVWAPLRFRVPWNVALGNAQDGNVTVAGDAMHPMMPDLSQGGCSALEDVVVLAP